MTVLIIYEVPERSGLPIGVAGPDAPQVPDEQTPRSASPECWRREASFVSHTEQATLPVDALKAVGVEALFEEGRSASVP